MAGSHGPFLEFAGFPIDRNLHETFEDFPASNDWLPEGSSPVLRNKRRTKENYEVCSFWANVLDFFWNIHTYIYIYIYISHRSKRTMPNLKSQRLPKIRWSTCKDCNQNLQFHQDDFSKKICYIFTKIDQQSKRKPLRWIKQIHKPFPSHHYIYIYR